MFAVMEIHAHLRYHETILVSSLSGAIMLGYKASLGLIFTVVLSLILGTVGIARADTTTLLSPYSPRALQQALGVDDNINLLHPQYNKGLGLSGGYFSGRASGVDSGALYSPDGSADHATELEGDQRVYALLVDGHYDFNYDRTNDMILHPYVMGGMGVARYGQQTNAASTITQNGDMVPLFRVGGGVTYRLGQQWNLSLDYKAGFSALSDQLFTGRNQQSVDLQSLNMGMHFKF